MEIGDVVHLKSGGPKMTVEIITEAMAGMVIRCVWFDGQELKRGIFPAATLEVAEDENDDDEVGNRSLGYVGFGAKKPVLR